MLRFNNIVLIIILSFCAPSLMGMNHMNREKEENQNFYKNAGETALKIFFNIGCGFMGIMNGVVSTFIVLDKSGLVRQLPPYAALSLLATGAGTGSYIGVKYLGFSLTPDASCENKEVEKPLIYSQNKRITSKKQKLSDLE
jgi:hypothetical protein